MTRADEHAARYRASTRKQKAGWLLALLAAPLYIAADMLRPESPSPTEPDVTKCPGARLSIRTQGQKGAR